MDNGQPQRSSTTRVSLEVVSVPKSSLHPPQVGNAYQHAEITESDAIGFLVSLVQAEDEDGDGLWYDIVGKFSCHCLS